MSLFFPDAPAYAETHFKFKLPWSLLYRPWPEIFFDAPFQCVPDCEAALWLIVRDADRFPVRIKNIFVDLHADQKKETRIIPFDCLSNDSFAFYKISLGILRPGDYKIFPSVEVERTFSHSKKIKKIARWNFPFLSSTPLRMRVLREMPPKPLGYWAGELHCHTKYSADHVEFGASPEVMQQAAESVGLDFVCFTDHAYDFAFRESDYTKETDPAPRFDDLKKEIDALKKFPLLIHGEEVSVGNSQNENVHLLSFAPKNYLAGMGDCGRFWLNNFPTFPVKKILDEAHAPCFAAHPKMPLGALEKFIFRRGEWGHDDLCLSKKNKIRGLQFWNGSRDEGFNLGKAFWLDELRRGNFLLPIGGNDAHGDLNSTTSVSIPLFRLRHSSEHIFGKVRTVLRAEELSEEGLKRAFEEGNLYLTDGPALYFDRENSKVHFHARTNEEQGNFRTIKFFGRRKLTENLLAKNEELLKESLIAPQNITDVTIDFENFAYLRAEAETSRGLFALTSACVNT